MNQAALKQDTTTQTGYLYMALELSDRTWRLAFGDGAKQRQVRVGAGDLVGVREAIERAQARFGLSAGAVVVSCYEAGRDGFWLHRYLASVGIANVVVDSASIELNRRARRAKTDRLDASKLLAMLIRYHRGERGVWSVLRIPDEAGEDERRPHRELERLKKERTGHRNRLQSLLVGQGLRVELKRGFVERLRGLRRWDGTPVPEHLKAELEREYARLELVDGQIKALEGERRERARTPTTAAEHQAVALMQLAAIGESSAWLFVREGLVWRGFRNRQELAAWAGLTATPQQSGERALDRGISKAGNRRIRSMAVEIAWLWLRYQPHSALTGWFNARFAHGGKRMRRIGIVALARRLLIALWRYATDGVMPAGARLIPSKALA